MRRLIITAISLGGLLAASSPLLAQDAARVPGTPGSAPLSRNGSGLDSSITGTSEGGRGGTGGSGGILSNGTSDNAGTATGGPAGGNPTTSGSGGGGN